MTIHATVNRPDPASVSSAPSGEPVDALDYELVRVLADPLRARIVLLLTTEQLCTCHLAEITGSLPSAVSNQLGHLRRAGVVQREVAGRYTYYRVVPEALRLLGAQLTVLADRSLSAEKRPC